MNRQKRIGAIQQKILLLLMAGVAFGLCQSPTRQWRIIKEFSEEWKSINRRALQQATKKLYASRFIRTQKRSDGTYDLLLTATGKQKAQQKIHQEKISSIFIKKQSHWDGVWHIVMFDIPEFMSQIRNGFRHHLKRLGFCELQKSVFAHPYPCTKEIEALANFYDVRERVCILSTKDIDQNSMLQKHFKIH